MASNVLGSPRKRTKYGDENDDFGQSQEGSHSGEDPVTQDFNEFLDGCVRYCHMYDNARSFVDTTTVNLGTGAVLFGAADLTNRVRNYLDAIDIYVVYRRFLATTTANDIKAAYISACTSLPCVVVFSELELLPGELEAVMVEKVTEMATTGKPVITLLLTERQNLVVSDILSPRFKTKVFKEMEAARLGGN